MRYEPVVVAGSHWESALLLMIREARQVKYQRIVTFKQRVDSLGQKCNLLYYTLIDVNVQLWRHSKPERVEQKLTPGLNSWFEPGATKREKTTTSVKLKAII